MKRNTAIFEKILSKLLLHGTLNRRQTAEGFTVSHVASAAYMNSLMEQGLVTGVSHRVSNVKRPVEFFQINGGIGQSLALNVGPQGIACELVRADATVLASHEIPLPALTQVGLTDAVRQAHAWAVSVLGANRTLGTVGLSVCGYIEPASGMIFRVRGIDDWEPCHLGDVVEELSDVETIPWSATACKLMGFSRQLQCDDGIGYVEIGKSLLAVASMYDGELKMGRFGTAGRDLHQQVSRDGERCACGRRGCFAWHLRHGTCDSQMLRLAIPRVIQGMGVTHVGVEWAGGDAGSLGRCADEENIITIGSDQAERLRRDGLRSGCSMALLRREIERRFAPRPFRRINHDAFRGGQALVTRRLTHRMQQQP